MKIQFSKSDTHEDESKRRKPNKLIKYGFIIFLLVLLVVYIRQGKMTITEQHFNGQSYSCTIEQDLAMVDYRIHFDGCQFPTRWNKNRFQLCKNNFKCHVNYRGNIIEADDYQRSTSLHGQSSKREVRASLVLPLNEPEHTFEVCCADRGVTGLWFEWGEFGCTTRTIKTQDLFSKC